MVRDKMAEKHRFVILLKCDAGSDSRPPQKYSQECFFLSHSLPPSWIEEEETTCSSTISPHMVNRHIVPRVFFFRMRKKSSSASCPPSCGFGHPTSNHKFQSTRKRGEKKNDGVDVLVAVTAYVFARHLWPPRIDAKEKNRGSVRVLLPRAN